MKELFRKIYQVRNKWIFPEGWMMKKIWGLGIVFFVLVLVMLQAVAEGSDDSVRRGSLSYDDSTTRTTLVVVQPPVVQSQPSAPTVVVVSPTFVPVITVQGDSEQTVVEALKAEVPVQGVVTSASPFIKSTPRQNAPQAPPIQMTASPISSEPVVPQRQEIKKPDSPVSDKKGSDSAAIIPSQSTQVQQPVVQPIQQVPTGVVVIVPQAETVNPAPTLQAPLVQQGAPVAQQAVAGQVPVSQPQVQVASVVQPTVSVSQQSAAPTINTSSQPLPSGGDSTYTVPSSPLGSGNSSQVKLGRTQQINGGAILTTRPSAVQWPAPVLRALPFALNYPNNDDTTSRRELQKAVDGVAERTGKLNTVETGSSKVPVPRTSEDLHKFIAERKGISDTLPQVSLPVPNLVLNNSSPQSAVTVDNAPRVNEHPGSLVLMSTQSQGSVAPTQTGSIASPQSSATGQSTSSGTKASGSGTIPSTNSGVPAQGTVSPSAKKPLSKTIDEQHKLIASRKNPITPGMVPKPNIPNPNPKFPPGYVVLPRNEIKKPVEPELDLCSIYTTTVAAQKLNNQQNPAKPQMASEKKSNSDSLRAMSLTTELRNAASSQQAKIAIGPVIGEKASERRDLMLRLAVDNPDAFLENVITAAQQQNLLNIDEELEQEAKLEGYAQVWVGESFTPSENLGVEIRSDGYTYILTVGKESYFLRFPSSVSQRPSSGDKIAVNGYLLEENVVVKSFEKVSANRFAKMGSTSETRTDLLGELKVLIIVSYPENYAAPDISNLEESMKGVDKYIRAASYGQAWLKWKVMGPYKIPYRGIWDYKTKYIEYVDPQINFKEEGYAGVITIDRRACSTAGVNAGGCASLGKIVIPTDEGDISVGVASLPNQAGSPTLTHEFLHATGGLAHSNELVPNNDKGCSFVNYYSDAVYGNCKTRENFGSDIMGGSSSYLDTAHADKLGWLSGNRLIESKVDGGVFKINRLENSKGPVGIRIPLEFDGFRGEQIYYYVESREFPYKSLFSGSNGDTKEDGLRLSVKIGINDGQTGHSGDNHYIFQRDAVGSENSLISKYIPVKQAFVDGKRGIVIYPKEIKDGVATVEVKFCGGSGSSVSPAGPAKG